MVNASSVALLDQMKASPGRRFDIFSGERRGLRYSAFCDGLVQLASFAEALR
ncbi:MAG: hypothetical protein IPQ09_15020 [Myxococcales bacterium]|nr:hypothetical protein [Myxococcales bacterium]